MSAPGEDCRGGRDRYRGGHGGHRGVVEDARLCRPHDRGKRALPLGFCERQRSGASEGLVCQNVADPILVSELAVEKIVARGVLTKPVASARVAELLKR